METSTDCRECLAIKARLTNVEQDTGEQWTAINDGREKFEEALREIGNRLPNWAAVVLTAGGTISGCIIGVLATLLAAG